MVKNGLPSYLLRLSLGVSLALGARMVPNLSQSNAVDFGEPTNTPIPKGELNGFCVRADQAEVIAEAVANYGVTAVRIAGHWSDATKYGTEFSQAISMAEAVDITPIVMINPTRLESNKTIITFINKLLDSHPNVVIELGNEADNIEKGAVGNAEDGEEFWQDGNLTTYSQFLRTAIDAIRSRDKNTPIIIGAMANPVNITSLLSEMTRAGINLKDNLLFAVHAYQTLEDARDRLELTRRAFAEYGIDNSDIFFSEIGTYGVFRGNEIGMLALAQQETKGGCVHEYKGEEQSTIWALDGYDMDALEASIGFRK